MERVTPSWRPTRLWERPRTMKERCYSCACIWTQPRGMYKPFRYLLIFPEIAYLSLHGPSSNCVLIYRCTPDLWAPAKQCLHATPTLITQLPWRAKICLANLAQNLETLLLVCRSIRTPGLYLSEVTTACFCSESISLLLTLFHCQESDLVLLLFWNGQKKFQEAVLCWPICIHCLAHFTNLMWSSSVCDSDLWVSRAGAGLSACGAQGRVYYVGGQLCHCGHAFGHKNTQPDLKPSLEIQATELTKLTRPWASCS